MAGVMAGATAVNTERHPAIGESAKVSCVVTLCCGHAPRGGTMWPIPHPAKRYVAKPCGGRDRVGNGRESDLPPLSCDGGSGQRSISNARGSRVNRARATMEAHCQTPFYTPPFYTPPPCESRARNEAIVAEALVMWR